MLGKQAGYHYITPAGAARVIASVAEDSHLGTLYLVATPIGNLEDITLRALRVLSEVAVIAAEDTRHTRKLLVRYEIKTPLISYHLHNERDRASELVQRLASGDVAVVSDAGTPTVSDPGGALVAAAIAGGHAVVPVPGPSAPLAALVAAGLPTERFLFIGFPPRAGRERRAALRAVRDEPGTLVFFEAPHRLRAMLADAHAELGNRPAVAAREITKLHEEFARGSLAELIELFAREAPRGEITLVIAGRPPSEPGPAAAPERDSRDLATALQAGLARGLKPRAAASEAARATGRPVNEIYRILIERKASDRMK